MIGEIAMIVKESRWNGLVRHKNRRNSLVFTEISPDIHRSDIAAWRSSEKRVSLLGIVRVCYSERKLEKSIQCHESLVRRTQTRLTCWIAILSQVEKTRQKRKHSNIRLSITFLRTIRSPSWFVLPRNGDEDDLRRLIELSTHFLRCEIVLDVECSTDLFGSFAFDHVRHCFTRHIEQTFDVEIVRSLKRKLLDDQFDRERTTDQNQFEKGSLIHFEKLDVPRGNIRAVFLLNFVIFRLNWIVFMMGSVLNDLNRNRSTTEQEKRDSDFFQNIRIDVGQRNDTSFFVHAEIFKEKSFQCRRRNRSVPSNIVLIVVDCLATSTSTSNVSSSLDCNFIFCVGMFSLVFTNASSKHFLNMTKLDKSFTSEPRQQVIHSLSLSPFLILHSLM